MSNRRALAKATKESREPKPVAKPKDIILDPAGQWKFPGQPTRIPSNEITMDSVNYPVWAVPNVGQPTMMQPGSYHTFPGAKYVDEYPQMAEGGMAEPSSPILPPEELEKILKDLDAKLANNEITQKQYEYLKNKATDYYNIQNKLNFAKKQLISNEISGDKFQETYDALKKDYGEKYNKEGITCGVNMKNCPKDEELEKLYPTETKEKILVGTNEVTKYNDQGEIVTTVEPIYDYVDKQPKPIIEDKEPEIQYEKPKLELKENKLPGFVYRSPEQDRRWIDYTKPTPFKKGKEYGHIPWSPYSAALRLFTGYDKGDSEKQLKEEIESAKEEGRPINFKGIPLMGKSDLKQRRSYKNALENYYESEKKLEEQNQKKQEDYEKAMIEYNNYMLEEEAKRKASGLESDKYGGSILEYKRGGSNSKRFSRSLEATNRFFAENKLFKKPKKLSKKRIYDPAAKYYQAGGVTLPEDYSQFESFAETLPTNLQDPNFEYGNPDQYDLYGMWETVGKPNSFAEVQDSEYFPLQDDDTYHGFTVGSDGIFLKPMSHGTTWKEVMNSQLNMDPFFQQNRIIKNEQGRLQYVPNEEDDYIEADLTPEEIEQYKKGGYIVEEVNDPSIPILTKAAKGGEQGCPPGQYWDGVKCTRLITLKNDKKYIDGVANWAMHVDNNDVRKGITSAYNDQIKNYLYSGNYGFDPESGSLIKLSKVQPKSVTTLDVKTKASREKEKLAEQHHYAEEENKKAYEKSITDAGFDPATFGKAKGINTITGEPIYASSKEEAERKNQEAINQAAIEGHAAVVNNPVFQAASYFTPWGMAIGAMRGAARLAPDTYNFAKDPSWSGAGQLGMDLAEISPFAKPIASAVKTGVQNTYKINPWAFKPDQSKFYRQIGKSGLDDALSSNVIRSADQTTFPRPYFVEGKDFKMLEQTGSGAHGRPSVIFETSGVTNEGIPFVSPANANAGYTPWIANMSEVPLTEGRLLKQNWLKGYKEVPKQLPGSPNAPVSNALKQFFNRPPGPMMLLGSSGSGNMIKKNMNYYKQLLESYDAKKMSSANRKFYNDLIETGKKQDGMVTEAQLRELDRLKNSNFDFGKRGYPPPPQRAGFLNPLAIADAIFPRINPFSFIEDGGDLMSISPLNLVPGYGKNLSGKNQAFRKFGNSIQDVIDRQALSPKGGSSLRIGRDRIVSEGNWAAPDRPWEKYSGVFGAKFDFNHPERNIGMQGFKNRSGVLITDRQGNPLPEIPLTEPGMSFNRRLPFSTRYVPIDKQKLIDNKFQLATFAPHLQSLAEKYGIGLVIAATLGAMGYPNAVEKYNQYTIDPIKDWTKEQWESYKKSDLYKKGKEIDKKLGVDFLYDKKKKGGVTNDYMEMDIPQDQVQWYIDNGYDVEILD